LAALIGGGIGYSRLFVNHRLPLPAALDAERVSFDSPTAGLLSYYVDRQAEGRPLVLIHSINAAASAYEMRPLFERYRGRRPVYALELPGFGFSARSDRNYTPELYARAIIDFLESQLSGQDAADLVTFSLSSEFAACAALERRDLIRTLTLISPTGFSARGQERTVQSANRRGVSERVLRVLSFPVWSQALYDLLASPPSLRYFLERAFVGPVDPGLLAYSYATSHQPGARFAPLSFISGKLFNFSIRETVYERLQQPVLVLYDQDVNVGFEMLPDMLERPNWRGVRIQPTLGLPHFERLPETAAALDQFWQSPPQEPSS
jgi:pimeloyl-ACP methyl ester carboxylesterase